MQLNRQFAVPFTLGLSVLAASLSLASLSGCIHSDRDWDERHDDRREDFRRMNDHHDDHHYDDRRDDRHDDEHR